MNAVIVNLAIYSSILFLIALVLPFSRLVVCFVKEHTDVSK